jgi:hypothetical protein
LGRLRELTLKGSLTSPTSITWKGTSYRDTCNTDKRQIISWGNFSRFIVYTSSGLREL